MRTTEEIIARINDPELKERDFFGFEASDLISALPYKDAIPFLEPGVTEDQWKVDSDIKAVMLDYMPFAWEKANGRRGLSAGRSMSHYMAWTWLAGDDFGDLTDYQFYGKDNLVRICKHYGWDHTQWDDGVRKN